MVVIIFFLNSTPINFLSHDVLRFKCLLYLDFWTNSFRHFSHEYLVIYYIFYILSLNIFIGELLKKIKVFIYYIMGKRKSTRKRKRRKGVIRSVAGIGARSIDDLARGTGRVASYVPFIGKPSRRAFNTVGV